MDDRIRQLERSASQGDLEAAGQLQRESCRRGDHDTSKGIYASGDGYGAICTACCAVSRDDGTWIQARPLHGNGNPKPPGSSFLPGDGVHFICGGPCCVARNG